MIASIIVTNFNYGKFLSRCLRSCLGQNIAEEYEVILIDDNSKDKSEKIAKEFQLIKNFKFLKNKKNIGVAASANKAIKLAKGKYILRVDADDFISKNSLKYLVLYLENRNDLFGVACDYCLINKYENKMKMINSREYPISCGILYDRIKFIKYGLYNKNFRHREEEELRIRLGSNYKLEYLHIPLYRYRMHSENKTKQGAYKLLFKRKISILKNNQLLKKIKKEKILIKEKVYAIIPARGGSKRFKLKNIANIWGKPMLHWTLQAAKDSKIFDDIYVSTDHKGIKKVAKNSGVKIINREKNLAKDDVPKIFVVSDAIEKIKKTKKIKKNDIIVVLQANSVGISCYDITKCVYSLKKYKRNEIMSLDKNLMQNAAIRVLKSSSVNQKFLSTYCGGVVNDAIDVHYKKDIKNFI